MIDLRGFNSLIDLIQTFSTEEKCIEYLEKVRWNGNVISPFDSTSKVYKCSKGYWCKNTNKIFNVKTKTLFENTKIPLQKWFIAIWLITSHKKGISSIQLSKDINVTQKSSWFMLQRIRNCFEIENNHILNNKVEIDETYIGGSQINKNTPKSNETKGRSLKTKTPIIGMVERNGKLLSYTIENAKSSTLTPIITNKVNLDATIYTDKWRGYNTIDKIYNHLFVKHSSNEFIKGDVSTNTIEGFWGLLKRGFYGIYHRISKKHLQMYLDEFVFRYNTRKLNNSEKFNILLSNMANRLRYNDLKISPLNS